MRSSEISTPPVMPTAGTPFSSLQEWSSTGFQNQHIPCERWAELSEQGMSTWASAENKTRTLQLHKCIFKCKYSLASLKQLRVSICVSSFPVRQSHLELGFFIGVFFQELWRTLYK